MEEKKYLIAGLVLVFVLLSVGFVYWLFEESKNTQPAQSTNEHVVVTSFEECVAAGYPVMESYPRQCSDDSTGQNFVEEIIMPEPYPLETQPVQSPNECEQNGCVITGCNGELCVSEEMSQLMGVTPCVMKPEFACYKESICSHDVAGECAWQETSEFSACIEEVRMDSENGSIETAPGLQDVR